MFVSTPSWTTCRLSARVNRRSCWGLWTVADHYQRGRRGCGIRLLRRERRSNGSITRIFREQRQHTRTPTLSTPKKTQKKPLPCLLRTPAARSLSNTNWLTYTLHSPLGTNSKHTSFIIVTLRSLPSHQASGRSFPRCCPLLWQSRSLLTRSHAQLNPTSPPGAFNDLW